MWNTGKRMNSWCDPSWVETTNATVQWAHCENVKRGTAALFFTLLTMLLMFGQDSACIPFCTWDTSGWNMLFKYIEIFSPIQSGVLGFNY